MQALDLSPHLLPRPAPATRVREARFDDLERVLKIYGQAIQAGRCALDVAPPSLAALRRIFHRMDPREALLVIERDGELLGFGWLHRYSHRLGYRYACETSIYIDHEAHGRGLGLRLQSCLLKQARQAGFRHVTVRILAANTRSLGFHRRFGFEKVGIQRGIGHLEGTPQDVVLLGLTLPPPLPVAPASAA